jgi:tetratricopeptide (TPR) repeat protein
MTAAKVGFVGRRGLVWTFIASWFIPITMTLAYIVLALTSETDASGWGWMSIGLAFVFVLWWLFRALSHSAAMSRAIAVGDTDRIIEIAGDKLPIHRALAYELRGDWAKTLSSLAEARPTKPRDQVLAATVRIGALVETGEVARARAVLDGDLGPLAKVDERMDAQIHIFARLARGRVLAAERSNTEALAALQKVIDDVRTGASTRAIAHHYAARAAAAEGDHAAADRHRAKAAELLPGTWIAG